MTLEAWHTCVWVVFQLFSEEPLSGWMGRVAAFWHLKDDQWKQDVPELIAKGLNIYENVSIFYIHL
jgi:hypothetical protein